MNQATLFDRINPEPVREDRYTAHQRELDAEAQRLDGSKAKVLAALQDGPKTNVELNAICYRYGARIFELKREGYPIEKAHQGGGVWTYELLKEASK